MLRVQKAHRKENPVRIDATPIKHTLNTIVSPVDIETAFEVTPLVWERVARVIEVVVLGVAEGGNVKAAFGRPDSAADEPPTMPKVVTGFVAVAGDVTVAEGALV